VLKKLFIITCLLSVIFLAVLLDACKKTPVIYTGTTPLNFTVPNGFPQPVYNFSLHPTTEQGFQLGRKLFWDGRLSQDGYHQCSSCHQQVAAFTTYEHDRSHGLNFQHTLRNSPGIANLAWYPYYLQDGGSNSIQSIALNHITNPKEMGETMPDVINKLKNDKSYQRMFREAFGTSDITSDRILNALEQFVINMVSVNSKYDKVKNGQATFTAQEQSGYQTFLQKCNICHTEPLFTDFSFRNVGLPVDDSLLDYGRMRVTGKPEDSIRFRVPSLRNVDLTSYYTHDGRFSMMRMMLEHYRYTVVQSPTLDPLLKNGIQMTQTEEDNLIEFMRTLSDSSYLTNPRFGQ
jgi:cytochrome c peroxidase